MPITNRKTIITPHICNQIYNLISGAIKVYETSPFDYRFKIIKCLLFFSAAEGARKFMKQKHIFTSPGKTEL